MRILMVNWAPIAPGTLDGGGVNGYSQQLALELVSRGHEVSWLSSGWTYVASSDGALAPVQARRMPDWRGVQVFDVINSPVIAPGPVQHKVPLAEVESPALEAEVGRLAALLRPDVVHFQNIEGLSAGCVRVMRDSGAAVIFSLHNYHTICPQVYLMQPSPSGRVACRSFEGGRACEKCIKEPHPRDESVRRGKEHPLAVLAAREFREASDAAARVPIAPPRGGLLQRVGLRSAPPPVVVTPPIVSHLPGRGVAIDSDLVPESGNGSPQEPLGRVVSLDQRQPEWAILDNVPTRDDSGSVNDFGTRRAAMVAMLSSCDAVLGVSKFVSSKFVALGVKQEAITTLTIGTRMAELAAASPELTLGPPAFDAARPRPLRVAFLGYHNYYKGLHVLADALELMAPASLARIELRVHAKAVEPFEWRLERLRGRLAGLIITRGYEYRDVPSLLSGVDVGVVPSVWWDNGPQTVMEMLAMRVPVLGAALGGVPDLVEHGVNGLLHRGNDRAHLASQLAELAADPARVATLRAGIASVKTMRAHTLEIEGVYAAAVRARTLRA
jgi:glycosyltransferase involved in cell wall biosynthesis